MRIKLSAVIPTVQYGNIQPEFEVDVTDERIQVDPDAIDKAQQILEGKIQALWDKYGEKPLVSKLAGTPITNLKRLKDFFGNEIDYDEVNHIYSWKGEIYESGSQHAKKFEKPFDGVAIAKKMAEKYGVKAQDIAEMWELKARTSREFGTALHSALELYGKYDGLAKELERDTAMHDHPVIKKAVESFYEDRDNEKAEYEVLVVDHKNKRAGQIDRLLIDGENDCTVQDFKINAVMTPDKLKVYGEQLKFYSGILEYNGMQPRPEQIFHYTGVWKTYDV